MNHRQAMAQTKDEQTACTCDLVHVSRGFWSDVNWQTYYCPACDAVVHMVEGSQHWWNYSPANSIYLEDGRRLAGAPSHNNALSDATTQVTA